MEIRMKIISSWFLCIDNKKLSKNIKPLGIRLKTYKILNSMLSQFMMTDM